jgi:dienelactone hydrolase
MPEGMRRSPLAVILVALLLTGCGHASAHLPPEVTGPANASGAVIVIHGGGWIGGKHALVSDARDLARRFSGNWRVYNVDYRSGSGALEDLTAVVDAVRAEHGRNFPVCAAGQSAGGHWALTLAEHRELACVVAEAAPTNLLTLGPEAQRMAMAAFGSDRRDLARWSPALHADALRAPALLVNAESDALVGVDQAQALAAVAPNARVLVLPTGDGGLWQVHTTVDANAQRGAIAEEQRFVAESLQAWVASRQTAVAPSARVGEWLSSAHSAPATTASGRPRHAAS